MDRIDKRIDNMDAAALFARYQDLQQYVGWESADAARVRQAAEILEPHVGELIDDFYDEILRHPQATKVLSEGPPQIERLKQSLRRWLHELFYGPYDPAYVSNRWRVGLRHVEIGLDQVYTNAALSRLRNAMLRLVCGSWSGEQHDLLLVVQSLNRLLDLDLAIIEDAYETEHLTRQREAERTRMEAALHQEKEFSDRLIEQAQAVVLVLDPAGRIVRYNPYMEQLTGRRLESVRGQCWFDVFLPEGERERIRDVFLSTVEDIDTSGTINNILTYQGRPRSISWSNATLKDVRGEVVAVLAIGHDITELTEAQQKLLQSERLAAIGQMITGLAHESRNALQRIQACAEMLELEVEDNDEALDLVHRIQMAQGHMNTLYEEVRNYAAPIQLARGAVQLDEVWREAWELLVTHRQGRDIEMTADASVDLEVRGDRFRLVQVFRNLLENAMAAAEDPVRIKISAGTVSENGREAVKVVVADNGPGLSQAARERIFEPFFTTKTRGTGLGMPIAQRIVEAHGGTLTIGDCSGLGARLLVTLPR